MLTSNVSAGVATSPASGHGAGDVPAGSCGSWGPSVPPGMARVRSACEGHCRGWESLCGRDLCLLACCDSGYFAVCLFMVLSVNNSYMIL